MISGAGTLLVVAVVVVAAVLATRPDPSDGTDQVASRSVTSAAPSPSRTTAASSHRPQGWRSHIAEFDWIVLALPGTPQTRGIIGAPELAAMKAEAVLVNFARADCVDQPALVEALAERRIAAAVLDLTDPEPLPPDHPFWSHPRVSVTPHAAGMGAGRYDRAADAFLENLERWRRGESLLDHVGRRARTTPDDDRKAG